MWKCMIRTNIHKIHPTGVLSINNQKDSIIKNYFSIHFANGNGITLNHLNVYPTKKSSFIEFGWNLHFQMALKLLGFQVSKKYLLNFGSVLSSWSWPDWWVMTNDPNGLTSKPLLPLLAWHHLLTVPNSVWGIVNFVQK